MDLLNEEEALSERRGMLEARDNEVQAKWKELKEQREEMETGCARLYKESVVRETLASVLEAVFVQAAEHQATAAIHQQQAIKSLFSQLSQELAFLRSAKSSLFAQASSLLSLQSSMQTSNSELEERLALARQGQAQLLIARRDEIVHRKEAVFNEKLGRLRERERELREREQDLVLREAKLLAKEGSQPSINPTPVDKNISESVLKQRKKELKTLESSLKSRGKVLEEQEACLQQAVSSLEVQKNQVKKAWEAAQLKLDQAHNLELRVEAMKREIERKQRDDEAKIPSKIDEKELIDTKEVKRLRAELRKKGEELRVMERNKGALELQIAELEALVSEKDKELERLQARSGVTKSADDFTQAFLQRQQSMLKTLDQATQEKREMSQTLRTFLSEWH